MTRRWFGILSPIRPATARDYCDFVWLNTEAYGPVDPTCGGEAKVLLGTEGNEVSRCLGHAAYELAYELLDELGTEEKKVPREAFKSLCVFFEAWLNKKLKEVPDGKRVRSSWR